MPSSQSAILRPEDIHVCANMSADQMRKLPIKVTHAHPESDQVEHSIVAAFWKGWRLFVDELTSFYLLSESVSQKRWISLLSLEHYKLVPMSQSVDRQHFPQNREKLTPCQFLSKFSSNYGDFCLTPPILWLGSEIFVWPPIPQIKFHPWNWI